MKIKDIKENYYFETLTENHALNDFDCGDKDLNDFLKNDALQQQNEQLNVTKLAMHDGKIIGYASLLTDTLMLKNIKNKDLLFKIKEKLGITSNNKGISAVKIGRLAIDKRYSGKGLGSHILDNILANLKKISKNHVGFRFIIVEGYAKALNFYIMKTGFENLEKDKEKVKNIDFISQRDPTKKFFLYFDLNRY